MKAGTISGFLSTMTRVMRVVAGNAPPPSKSAQRKQAEHERCMALRREVTITESSLMQRRKRYERWMRNRAQLTGHQRMPGHIREKGVM